MRENLTYAAKMYLGPQPADTRAKLVDALLADLGLETCADVVWVWYRQQHLLNFFLSRVGNQLLRSPGRVGRPAAALLHWL